MSFTILLGLVVSCWSFFVVKAAVAAGVAAEGLMILWGITREPGMEVNEDCMSRLEDTRGSTWISTLDVRGTLFMLENNNNLH